jgi:hypothetical protein
MAEVEEENKQLHQQLEAANSSRKISEENQLPDGVKVRKTEEVTLKKSPWKFIKWDKQGHYLFPLIVNPSGNPAPISSAEPPPEGSLPQTPKGQWELADWEVKLPNGTVLALNGWAKRQ